MTHNELKKEINDIYSTYDAYETTIRDDRNYYLECVADSEARLKALEVAYFDALVGLCIEALKHNFSKKNLIQFFDNSVIDRAVYIISKRCND